MEHLISFSKMSLLKGLLLIVTAFFVNTAFAQKVDSTLVMDQNVFFLVKDIIVQTQLKTDLIGFLNAKNSGSRNNPYVDPDYLKLNLEPFSWFIGFDRNADLYPKVLAVIPVEDNGYLIKLAYMSMSKEPGLAMIMSLVAKKKQKRYYFYSALMHNTRLWKKRHIGSVNYIYSNGLNIKKAAQMDRFNTSFAQKFGAPVIPITYYKCDDPEQLFKMMGYDYIPNMYYSTSGGLAEAWTSSLFAGNNSELYEHEAVHFYMATFFPNRNKIVDEGYATYLGGSGGTPLTQLAVFAKNYIKLNPEKITSELATDFAIRVDGNVPITYILSGVICKDIESRFGIKGIRKMFTPKDGDDYFDTLFNVTGVAKKDFNAYLINLLKKYK